MTDRIESQGKTVDDAVAEALLQLGARRDEVTVEVLDEGKGGLLGFFGGRPARVAVTRKPAAARGEAAPGSGGARGRREEPREARRDDRRDDRRGERRGGRQERRPEPRDARPARAAEPGRAEPAREGDRGRRRGGRGRGRGGEARPEGTPRPARQAPEDLPSPAVPAPADRQAESPRPLRQPPERVAPPVDEPEILGEEVRAVEVVKPLRGVEAAGVPEALERLTGEVMRLAGFPCRIEVVPDEYHLVKIVTDDASAGVLIGRHGATIDALEHVVERMIGQAVGDRVNLNLDVNNYRRRRQEALVERARQLAERVRQTGREIHLEPLCARERRVIHLEVAKLPGLRTFTLGGFGGKHVVIAPEGLEGAGEPRDEAVEEGERESDWRGESADQQPEAGPPPEAGPDSLDQRP